MSKLLHSKAFWTALVDMLVKVVLVVGESYFPDQLPLFNALWLAAQPVVFIVIAAFCVDDVKEHFNAVMYKVMGVKE